MWCSVLPPWLDMEEEVTWPALQLHTLQPHSTSYQSWCFPLAVWWTVQLPLRHTQRLGQCVCGAIGGLLHPHLSLHSIWDMWLGLSTAYSHHCCLVVHTDHRSVCHNILGYWMYPRIWFWRHEPCLWVLPFSTIARNLPSSRFRVLSGSCLTAGGHAASFINQVYIILVNSFVIPGCIMNGVGLEAQACAFSCFRAHNKIMCSSGVCLLPFLALAISRVSLNSGLSMEHICCHVFPPAHVFPSGLGNIPVTEIGASPFPYGGVILDVGRCPASSVVWGPTADADADAGIISTCSSTGTNVPALSGKKPL